jgi:hypothetical protein
MQAMLNHPFSAKKRLLGVDMQAVLKALGLRAQSAKPLRTMQRHSCRETESCVTVTLYVKLFFEHTR